jgi:hypothetical protein
VSRYHVESLRGGYVTAEATRGGNTAPSYHVCDERGHTVFVVYSGRTGRMLENGSWLPYGNGEWVPAHEVAEVYADYLNQRGAHTAQGEKSHYAVIEGLRFP